MTINVTNDFCTEKLEELKAALINGEKVHIYVDCIGHTRAEWVEAAYVRELKKEFGDRLENDESWFTHYWLA